MFWGNGSVRGNVHTYDGVNDPYLEKQLKEQIAYLKLNSSSNGRLRRVNRFFRREISDLVISQIPAGSSVLDIGCGDGSMLLAANASSAVGIDMDGSILIDELEEGLMNHRIIESAIEKVDFSEIDESFKFVVMSGLLEHVYDILSVFQKVREACIPETRVIVVSYSRLWQPIFRLAERLKLKAALPTQNWVPVSEIQNLSFQSGFEFVKTQRAILVPFYVPLVSRWVNKWLAPLPIIRQFTFAHLTILRPFEGQLPITSVSIVVAARNESGNIKDILDRIPRLATRQEIIFVEGNSMDDTWDVILDECSRRRAAGYPFEIKAIQQSGKGKGDAVRAGFEESTGEALIILDADLSVPPEELPRFIDCLRSGAAEFVNGSRLVYGMEGGAMRFLNLLGNRFFGSLFTFLLGQPVRDTLCGTKALTKERYLEIVENRGRFGDFDPFGDFDLLFGAAALNLKIRDQPVHYKARTYGSTNISRFSHGFLLLRMSWIAARRIRFI